MNSGAKYTNDCRLHSAFTAHESDHRTGQPELPGCAIPRYDDRHRVPVGLTGLAQVHGLRGDTSIDERARLDNHYIENWSLWHDIVIIFQTVFVVIQNVARTPPCVWVESTTTPLSHECLP